MNNKSKWNLASKDCSRLSNYLPKPPTDINRYNQFNKVILIPSTSKSITKNTSSKIIIKKEDNRTIHHLRDYFQEITLFYL